MFPGLEVMANVTHLIGRGFKSRDIQNEGHDFAPKLTLLNPNRMQRLVFGRK